MHEHDGRRNYGNQRGLAWAAGVTGVIMLAEFAGGLWTNSLALLSDAGHMLSDVSSLLLSLAAMRFALRPPSPRNTFGFYRLEILAALFNGVTLFIIAGLIVKESLERFAQPETVASLPMIVIAVIGLLANVISAVILLRQGDVQSNINLRSAYLHILGDALGSVGAIGAGAAMYFYEWYLADPLISVLVALIILKGAWRVLKESVHVLMEGAPADIDSGEIKHRIETIDGVVNVHDLRIWTLTSGRHSLSCHLLIDNGRDSQPILAKASEIIRSIFGIQYSAIQIEMQPCFQQYCAAQRST